MCPGHKPALWMAESVSRVAQTSALNKGIMGAVQKNLPHLPAQFRSESPRVCAARAWDQAGSQLVGTERTYEGSQGQTVMGARHASPEMLDLHRMTSNPPPVASPSCSPPRHPPRA